MTNIRLKKHSSLCRCLAVVLLVTLLISNGCKKDASEKQIQLNNDAFSEARQWYQKTYPEIIIHGKLSLQSVDEAKHDWSRTLSPYWDKGTAFKSKGWDFIELPALKKGDVSFSTQSIAADQFDFSHSASLTSLLIVKQQDTLAAYAMTIMADPVYLKGDYGKLKNNTYRSREKDFTGLVLYHQLNGTFVNGWQYINGKVTNAVYEHTNARTGTQSVSKQKTNMLACQAVRVTTYWENCAYHDNDSSFSNPFDCYYYTTESTYTSCSDDNGGGRGGGGSSQPPACPPVTPPTTTPGIEATGHTPRVMVVQEGPAPVDPSGGINPPATTPGNGCVVVAPPAQSTHPIFGVNGSNAVVPDGNFDNLLDYLEGLDLVIMNPYDDHVTINGTIYTGQITEIRDRNGNVVVAYFSPDAAGGTMQLGFEYSIGNKGPDGSGSSTSNVQLPYSPQSNFGNSSITYTPSPYGGGGGGALTRAQRQALETADNNRLLQLLQQEDAKDDAAAGDCHGTARNGNVMWPGTAEHWLIQFDYIAEHPLALKEYFVPGSSGKLNGNPGYADIVNPGTGEMFEIKPDNLTGQNAGAAEIQLYVKQANALCPRMAGGGWSAGQNYQTRYLPSPRDPSKLLKALLNSSGVIVYSSIPRDGQPQPTPVILPDNLVQKLKRLFQQIKDNPNTMQPQIVTFVRENPNIIPYLKGAAASVVIASLLEDIVTEGAGLFDDWESFLIARTLWRVSNGIVII